MDIKFRIHSKSLFIFVYIKVHTNTEIPNICSVSDRFTPLPDMYFVTCTSHILILDDRIENVELQSLRLNDDLSWICLC